MNDSKSAWQSRTVWLNVAVLTVSVLTILQENPWVTSDPRIAAGLVAVSAVAGIVVRLLTTQPVSIM